MRPPPRWRGRAGRGKPQSTDRAAELPSPGSLRSPPSPLRGEGKKDSGRTASRHEIAEPLQVLPLLRVARRQFEEPRRGAAEDVVLRLLGEERQVPDRA